MIRRIKYWLAFTLLTWLPLEDGLYDGWED